MIKSARFDFSIRRHEPLSLEIDFQGDLMASAITLEVRANVTDAAALLSAVAAKAIVVVDGDTFTRASFAIAEAAIDAIPEPVPLGSDLPAVHAVKVGGVEYLFGNAPIVGAANHA